MHVSRHPLSVLADLLILISLLLQRAFRTPTILIKVFCGAVCGRLTQLNYFNSRLLAFVLCFIHRQRKAKFLRKRCFYRSVEVHFSRIIPQPGYRGTIEANNTGINEENLITTIQIQKKDKEQNTYLHLYKNSHYN